VSDEEERRRANRARNPEIARIVDEVRAHFPGAQVVAIREMSADKKRMLEEYSRRHPT
jgi:hypothetical protein